MKTSRERADDVRKKLIIRHRIDQEDGQEEHVAQQYACDKVPRDPKNKKSKRWISLDNEIVAYLEEWKRTQRIELENRKRRLDREGDRAGEQDARGLEVEK